MRLADRIVVMSDGSVLQADTPERVYDEPADLFVARFVGSPGMNLVHGEVRETSGTRAFHPRSWDAPLLSLAASACRHPHGPAVLGIRPEFVELAERSPLRGRVVVDEYLGSSRCLHVETELGRLVARCPPDARGANGGEVGLRFDPEHVRLFDAKTGKRPA